MIRIQFDFKERKAEDLAQINRLLSTMKLRDLELENFEGYLETTKDGKGNLVHMRYGLDSGTLICTEAQGNQKGHTYQIDTVVVSNSAGPEGEDFLDCWRDTHPGQLIRIAITIGFGAAKAYTIAYHAK